MTARKIVVRFVFHAVIIGIVTAVTTEGALRIYNPIHVPLRTNNIVLRINETFTWRNPDNKGIDEVVVKKFNSLGFRGPDLPDNPEDYIKLFTVGGSTTACITLTDGKTWPDKLYALLKEKEGRYWLNNAGRDGHSTFGHQILLERYLLDLKPDYILFLVGINDVERTDLAPVDALLDPMSSLKQRLIASSELLATMQVLQRSLRAQDMGLNHRYDMNLRALPKIEVDPAVAAERLSQQRPYLDAYEARIRRLISMTRSAGAEPVFLTQPALFGDGVDPTTGVELGPLEYYGNTPARLQWNILELYNEALRDLAEKEGVVLIDLALKMPKDSRYYLDWIHYSNEGAEAVADIVASELIPHMRDVRDSVERATGN